MKLILIGESGFLLGTHWLIFGFLSNKKIADLWANADSPKPKKEHCMSIQYRHPQTTMAWVIGYAQYAAAGTSAGDSFTQSLHSL